MIIINKLILIKMLRKLNMIDDMSEKHVCAPLTKKKEKIGMCICIYCKECVHCLPGS